MSLEALKEAVAGKRRDAFVDGTVIRWMGGGSRAYTYAAIKVGELDRWYTTAQAQNNIYVPGIVTWKQLLEILTSDDSSRIEVSQSWTPIMDADEIEADEHVHNCLACQLREGGLNLGDLLAQAVVIPVGD